MKKYVFVFLYFAFFSLSLSDLHSVTLTAQPVLSEFITVNLNDSTGISGQTLTSTISSKDLNQFRHIQEDLYIGAIDISITANSSVSFKVIPAMITSGTESHFVSTKGSDTGRFLLRSEKDYNETLTIKVLSNKTALGSLSSTEIRHLESIVESSGSSGITHTRTLSMWIKSGELQTLQTGATYSGSFLITIINT